MENDSYNDTENTQADGVQQEEIQATQEELEEYARYLGMDPERDAELMWIAEQGLTAPLPSQWRSCQTEDGQIYYYNPITGDSIWEHPRDEEFRQLYIVEKKKKEAGMSFGASPRTSQAQDPEFQLLEEEYNKKIDDFLNDKDRELMELQQQLESDLEIMEVSAEEQLIEKIKEEEIQKIKAEYDKKWELIKPGEIFIPPKDTNIEHLREEQEQKFQEERKGIIEEQQRRIRLEKNEIDKSASETEKLYQQFDYNMKKAQSEIELELENELEKIRKRYNTHIKLLREFLPKFEKIQNSYDNKCKEIHSLHNKVEDSKEDRLSLPLSIPQNYEEELTLFKSNLNQAEKNYAKKLQTDLENEIRRYEESTNVLIKKNNLTNYKEMQSLANRCLSEKRDLSQLDNRLSQNHEAFMEIKQNKLELQSQIQALTSEINIGEMRKKIEEQSVLIEKLESQANQENPEPDLIEDLAGIKQQRLVQKRNNPPNSFKKTKNMSILKEIHVYINSSKSKLLSHKKNLQENLRTVSRLLSSTKNNQQICMQCMVKSRDSSIHDFDITSLNLSDEIEQLNGQIEDIHQEILAVDLHMADIEELEGLLKELWNQKGRPMESAIRKELLNKYQEIVQEAKPAKRTHRTAVHYQSPRARYEPRTPDEEPEMPSEYEEYQKEFEEFMSPSKRKSRKLLRAYQNVLNYQDALKRMYTRDISRLQQNRSNISYVFANEDKWLHRFRQEVSKTYYGFGHKFN